MKFISENRLENYDLGVFGLGYESRSTAIFQKVECLNSVVFGYLDHQQQVVYQSNHNLFLDAGAEIFQVTDDQMYRLLLDHERFEFDKPISVIIDITVLTRHRLSRIIWYLMKNLPEHSKVTICYALSEYVEPPEGVTPVRAFQRVIEELGGGLGDLNLPTALIIGLGYEHGKALGAVNFLDAQQVFTMIPKSPKQEFEAQVLAQNSDLLDEIDQSNIFYYDVMNPYRTYVDLKILIKAVRGFSRPLLLPLGPKILAAISVLIGLDEYPNLPVWRVSSNHEEHPIDRPPSDHEIYFTLEV